MTLDTLDTLIVRQSGLVSRRQAFALGMTPSAVDHRVRTRRWRPLLPQVYLARDHRYDDEVKIRAAVLWAGEGAVLSGVAAAWWHGMIDQVPPVVGITVARRRCPRGRPGLAVRRRELAVPDVTERRGVVLTARPLTLLEAAVELGTQGSALLDRGLQRWVNFPAVYRAHNRNLGRHGSASAGRLLVAAADRSASVAERLLVRMLRESGARGWRCGFPVGEHVVDVAFPAAKVLIEVDGWARHTDTERAQVDKRRQNALVRAGWTVLRYTWHDLVQRPRAVLAEIAHAVGLAAAP